MCAKLMAAYRQPEIRGIDLATGDYITFVDPDDWVTEDYVETLYTQLKKYEADVSIANYNLFNESTSKFFD